MTPQQPAVDGIESQRCLDSLEYVYKYKGSKAAAELMVSLREQLINKGVPCPSCTTTPYINTIPVHEQPDYPGDLEIEHRLHSYIRWNAMAMVVQANRVHDGLGGHISTFASSATLYEVAYNHIFRGNGNGYFADQVFFQGHAAPGNYARGFLEGRFQAHHLHHFRQDLAKDGGLSSYPHPYLMPNYWQFPTVSMGLGPVMAIYQARFNRYLVNRGFIKKETEPRVFCYVGDGESEEPETLGALSLASREGLDNLTFVVNCNLQRLDGPVRGNGKIIQELESVFTGAGWNVIKVIWGSPWDKLLESPQREWLIQRMNETLDGEFQKYTVEPGSYARKRFFGKYPELLDVVNHMTDDQIKQLPRGGHDPVKVYAGYQAALAHTGGPSVILAKTVKGYGLAEAGEGKNISHQQKKMNEKELREFRDRLHIPISDEEIVDAPFYRPPADSSDIQYLVNCREKLNGFLPERKESDEKLPVPTLADFAEFLKGSGDHTFSTTMAFVRILTQLLRDKEIGKRVVPIAPDESRTFGMESLFRMIGIYSSKGQLYEPADSESLLYYREAKDGQMIEEGINEVGAMCSFISAATCYATHGFPMIPFYIYYSMFGFQRIGDLMWLAGDMKAKGFLLGGTAGRTTLNGEGLQHQDGHSLLLASAIPNLLTYDPAFRYEVAVIIQDGLRRMYQEGEHVFYYLTLYNENYTHPEMPKGAEEGIIEGIYKLKKGKPLSEGKKKSLKVQLLGSGPILRQVLDAQEILQTQYGVSADVWSVTNYKKLRSEAMNCRRWNMLNPKKKPRKSYLEKALEKEAGVFVAVSDYMRAIPDQIWPWVPGGLFSLGTDGFGRSGTREQLREFFEVDTPSIVVASLYQLSEKGLVDRSVVAEAMQALGVNPEKVFPTF